MKGQPMLGIRSMRATHLSAVALVFAILPFAAQSAFADPAPPAATGRNH
jgi:hypothetical protein